MSGGYTKEQILDSVDVVLKKLGLNDSDKITTEKWEEVFKDIANKNNRKDNVITIADIDDYFGEKNKPLVSDLLKPLANNDGVNSTLWNNNKEILDRINRGIVFSISLKTQSVPTEREIVEDMVKLIDEILFVKQDDEQPADTTEPPPSDTTEPTPSDNTEPTPSDTTEPTPSDTTEPTPSDNIPESPEFTPAADEPQPPPNPVPIEEPYTPAPNVPDETVSADINAKEGGLCPPSEKKNNAIAKLTVPSSDYVCSDATSSKSIT